MKIIYISAHSILEYDEIKLFKELGHEVFSLHGAYQMGTGDGKRPALDMKIDTHLHDIAMQCSREDIHPELIAWADCLIFMHRSDWIIDNWEKLKGKKIVLRTIGQNNKMNENDIKRIRKDIKIVRMSPTEETIPNYQGKDALIRFYKDEEEYDNWQGGINRVVNVSQAMFGNDKVHSRGDHMNIDVFNKVVRDFQWRIYGPDNDNAKENNGGVLSYDDYKTMLKLARVYFYVGTQPSPYTLAFIEPMMTGIPIVSIGIDLGTNVYPDQKTWEIPQIIENGVNGYITDDVGELRDYIKQLLDDQSLAKRTGLNGRTTAIQLFGKKVITDKWKEFFKKI